MSISLSVIWWNAFCFSPLTPNIDTTTFSSITTSSSSSSLDLFMQTFKSAISPKQPGLIPSKLMDSTYEIDIQKFESYIYHICLSIIIMMVMLHGMLSMCFDWECISRWVWCLTELKHAHGRNRIQIQMNNMLYLILLRHKTQPRCQKEFLFLKLGEYNSRKLSSIIMMPFYCL